MMIKITRKCSMECTHCMNDSKPCEEHMTFDTFKNAIDFQNKYGASIVMITGGEPFEHPQWMLFLEYAISHIKNAIIEVATNGRFMQEQYRIMEPYVESRPVMFQVSNDTRYYPYKIDKRLRIFNLPNVRVIDSIDRIYPQGRARDMPYQAKGSKCYNIRAVVKQSGSPSLLDNIWILASKEKICTPHIDIDGGIRVGESDLCPVCSNIYKTGEQIVEDIKNFQCHACDFVNANLPEEYRKIIET